MANSVDADVSKPLSAMQLRYVEEYLLDPSSQSAAAKRAGYAPSTASQQATNLMRDPRVKKMISEANDYAIRKLGITQERVLQELALIAFSNTKGLIRKDDDGDDVLDLNTVSGRDPAHPLEVTASTIKGKSGKVTNMSYRTVKVSDKTAALQLLGKHLNMFKDKVEVTANLSLLDMIEQSFKAPALQDESNIVDSTAIVVTPVPEAVTYSEMNEALDKLEEAV